jgi:hypothetical protein
MTKGNYNKNHKTVQTNKWKTLGIIAIFLSTIALVSSSTLPNKSSIDVLAALSTNSHINDQTSASPQTAVQNLTKANVPVTLPLTRGYVNGFEVFYISTEASDKSTS